jgi:RNA-directed DNA polymerase
LDNVTIKAFKAALDNNLKDIQTGLRDGTYAFTKLRAHAVSKPGSTKQRPLQIASVRDRVVMKALALYIAPAFDKYNLPCSFAFIPRRGVGPALSRIQQLASEGNKFYFEADIINFFGAIDREVLWKMFSKNVRHRSLLPLIQKCFNLELENLQSHRTEFQELFLGSDSGIPQGGVLSPMLANFYLHEFDRLMLSHGFNLVRYADDFVVMCDKYEKAEQAHDLAREILRTLNLEIHPIGPHSKTRIANFSKEGLVFLGVRFEGKEIFPAKKAVERFELKIKEVLKPGTGTSLFKTLQQLTNLINGWGKCYKSMRVRDLYMRLDHFVKGAVQSYLANLGVLLTGKNKRKHMKLLGIPSLTAMADFSPDNP